MKNYKIKVSLQIIEADEQYKTVTLGQCELTKTVLLPASKVRDEATKVLRNAVAHFSESTSLGLAPIIDEEPKLDAPEPETLTV